MIRMYGLSQVRHGHGFVVQMHGYNHIYIMGGGYGIH